MSSANKAMDKIHLVEFMVLFLPLTLGTIKFPGRMTSIPGVTYFGSEQLFNTDVDDVKLFIANFTLPETGGNTTGVNGTVEEVTQQLKQHRRQKTTVTELVVHLTQSSEAHVTQARRDKTAHVATRAEESPPPARRDTYLLLNINDTILDDVTELWVFLPAASRHDNHYCAVLNLTPATFPRLRALHILSSESNTETSMTCVPHEFQALSRQLHLMHSNENYIILLKPNTSMSEAGESTMFGLFELEVYYLFRVIAVRNSYSIRYTPPDGSERMTSTGGDRADNLHLTFLQVRSSFMKNMPVNVHTHYRNLKVLDISHNVEDFTDDQTFVPLLQEALMFHPALRLFVSVNNIGQTVYRAQQQRLLLGGRQQDQITFPIAALEEGAMPSLSDCRLFSLDHQLNWTDRHVMCRIVKCFFELEQLPCDYDYIAHDAENCWFSIRLPISRHLVEVYLSNTVYPGFGVGMVWSRAWHRLGDLNTGSISKHMLFQTCYQPNMLRKIDASFDTIVVSPFVLVANDSTVDYNNTQIVGLDSLETLNLDFAKMSYDLLVNVITQAPLPSVKHLSMRGTNVQLPSDLRLCSKLVNITTINLSQNNINGIPQYFFDGCTKLKQVNLSGNSITTIPHEIHAWVERHDVTVDLSNNPLQCHCHMDAVKTIEWLHKHKQKYAGFSLYSCFGYHSQRAGSKLVADINTNDYLSHCRGWLGEEIAALIASSVLVGIAIAAAVTYIHKYRYRVVTCVIRALRWLIDESRRHRPERKFDYDVYLSYDADSLLWIRSMLLPELEILHGITCCLPDRNFAASGHLPHLICDFMDRCRCCCQ